MKDNQNTCKNCTCAPELVGKELIGFSHPCQCPCHSPKTAPTPPIKEQIIKEFDVFWPQVEPYDPWRARILYFLSIALDKAIEAGEQAAYKEMLEFIDKRQEDVEKIASENSNKASIICLLTHFANFEKIRAQISSHIQKEI